MTIDEVCKDNTIQLDIHGKIDINSSQEFQNTLLKAFQRAPNVVIDMKDTDYITSAGLRALVLGQKTAVSKGGKMLVINAGPAILDVFRVTGFGKLLTVQ